MVGEKPFTSVEHAFVDRKEWQALMKFTDGKYLKVGGDSYNFSEFLAKKMKKNKLRPYIVGTKSVFFTQDYVHLTTIFTLGNTLL